MSAKAETDQALQAFLVTARANPTADIVARGVSTEIRA
jgi:hypothetical protein